MNKIIQREWFGHKLYPTLYVLCLIVSMAAYLTLDVLQQSVDNYIDDNQKEMFSDDIIITHNQPFPTTLSNRVAQLNPNNIVSEHQFNAIAYTQSKDNDKSILTRIKSVSQAYPLYGSLQLSASGHEWAKGTVLVEKQVLDGLDSVIGDEIQIGEAQFTIANEIISEPDRPLTAFGFGARILIHESDLTQTELVGEKSRVNYRIEIKTTSIEQQNTLFNELSRLLKDTKINLKTAAQSSTSISNLSSNFLVFLKLLVIAVIALSGIGLMSVVTAFINKQTNTNAIRTALGETSTQIVKSYRLLFFNMTLASVVLAWLFSTAIIYFGQDMFSAILPNNLSLQVNGVSFAKAFAIALGLTFTMTYFSLKGIHNIKPVAVLHKHQTNTKNNTNRWLWVATVLFGIFILLYVELGNWSLAAQVFIAFVLIWTIFSLLTTLLMQVIRFILNRGWVNNWMLVLALQNIFRKNNQSKLFITSLSLTTMILGSIILMDYSIQQQLISTYPDDAPNFFLLDVQTHQQEPLQQMVGETLTFYPVVRARIDSVNGIKSETLKSTLSRYDNISRMFNLSYTNQLLDTEVLDSCQTPNQLFSPIKDKHVSVSILHSFAEFLQVKLGDEVVFNIQGIKVTSTISSIRKRLKRGPSPFFYFLFQPESLAKAPQIRFATAKISDAERSTLQTKIAKKFPGITTLDGASIAQKLKAFTDQLKTLVQVFTALSLFAGLLIFITSLISTSQDRLKESFYYRMMGMQSKDLLTLNLIEFISLGLFALNLGVVIASISSYLVITYWFSLNFIFPWLIYLIANFIFIITLILISLIYSKQVRQVKIVNFLQHETN